MVSTSLLLFSIGLWLAAACFALSLIRVTRRMTAWILISTALLFMTGQRAVSFIALISSGQPILLDVSEIAGLAASALFLAGTIRIRTYFLSIQAADTAVTASEAEMRLLRAAVESAAESVIVTDAAGTVLYVNPAFERNSGYAKAEAIGQNPRLLKSGRHDEAFYRDLWDTITQGDVWSGAFVDKRKDGTLCEEEAVISPIRDAGGQVVNYVCVKRDVTRERSLEAQVILAQKYEAIGVLAGGIAHDLNNMLTACSSYTELLQRDLSGSERLYRYTEQMQKVLSRSTSFVGRLLAVSRKQDVSPHPMSLNASVSVMMEDVLPCLVGTDVHLFASLAPGLGVVQADPGQIEQVLMNLVVNSRDAMPEGGTITIETANVSVGETGVSECPSVRPGSYVMLAVSDTGTGMDEATLARIFEPFFTTKETGKGTGLGLAVVYGIVKQSGGHIRVCSEPGLGTTFTIYIPRWGGPHAGADSAPMDSPFSRRCTEV